jgi:hypothetical protein
MSRRFNGRQPRRGRSRFAQRTGAFDRSATSPNTFEVEISDANNSEATLFDVFNWISSGAQQAEVAGIESDGGTAPRPARSQLTRLPSRTTALNLDSNPPDSTQTEQPTRTQQQTTLNSLIWLNDLLLDAVIDLKVELSKVTALNQRNVDSLAGLRADLTNVIPQKFARELARVLADKSSGAQTTSTLPKTNLSLIRPRSNRSPTSASTSANRSIDLISTDTVDTSTSINNASPANNIVANTVIPKNAKRSS